MILPIRPRAFTAAFAGLLIFFSHLSAQSQHAVSNEANAEVALLPVDTTITAQVPLDSDSVLIEVETSLLTDLSSAPAALAEVKRLPSILPVNQHKKTKDFIHSFTVTQRSFVTTMMQRKQAYFPLYEEQLQKYCLPDELKYLSIIESGLNPKAVSPVRAAGLWQFMPATGRQYQLYQDAYIDERLDPYKATEAACQYLKDLYTMFGNWELALAAYNCGPGNVRRAIRRSGNRTSFWQICPYLPRETRAYVPKFLAIAYVMSSAARYDFTSDSLAIPPASDTIVVSQELDMQRLARQLDVPLDDLRALNPQVKKNIVPGYLKEYCLRIPTDRKAYFTDNRSCILDSVSIVRKTPLPHVVLASNPKRFVPSSSGRLVHQVRSGEAISLIAARYRVSVTDIKRWNHLSGNLIKAGQKLVIVKNERPASKVRLATNSVQSPTRSL